MSTPRGAMPDCPIDCDCTDDCKRAQKPLRGDVLTHVALVDRDPMVVAMFERLPPPGGDWSRTERLKWMRALSHVFDLVYVGEGELKIE